MSGRPVSIKSETRKNIISTTFINRPVLYTVYQQNMITNTVGWARYYYCYKVYETVLKTDNNTLTEVNIPWSYTIKIHIQTIITLLYVSFRPFVVSRSTALGMIKVIKSTPFNNCQEGRQWNPFYWFQEYSRSF